MLSIPHVKVNLSPCCFFIQRLLGWGCSCQAVMVLSCCHKKCSHDPGTPFLTLVRAHTGLTAKLGADTEETYSKGYYICSSYSYENCPELKMPLKSMQSIYLFIWELFQTDSAFSSLWDEVSINFRVWNMHPEITDPAAWIPAWCVWCCRKIMQTPPVNRQPLCCLQQMQRHQTGNTPGCTVN